MEKVLKKWVVTVDLMVTDHLGQTVDRKIFITEAPNSSAAVQSAMHQIDLAEHETITSIGICRE